MNGFNWTEHTTGANGSFDKWTWIKVCDLPKLREIKDRDVYRSVWTYEKPDLFSRKIGHYHMDFDAEDNIEEARVDALRVIDSLENEYNINPDMLYCGFSGSKGFFIIIPHECFLKQPIEKPEEIYKMLGEFFKLGAGIFSSVFLGLSSPLLRLTQQSP